jgi:ankyrin repeat protein
LEVVKVLLEAGANVHIEENKALCWASSYGHLEIVKVLIEAGAKLPN